MLFDLPPELLSLVLKNLSPDTLLALQCTTRRDLFSLYRYGRGYVYSADERQSFALFRETHFKEKIYKMRQIVPPLMLKEPDPEVLKKIGCRGRNSWGRAVMAVHGKGLVPRSEVDRDVYLFLCVQARKGRVEQLEATEERELAVALVRKGRFHQVGVILRDYCPTTVEMVMAMLFFCLKPVVGLVLLTQELCDFWFLHAYTDSQKWLVNNLPDGISIDWMLQCNSMRFLAFATMATIRKYRIVDDREKYTLLSAQFFPALMSRRKRYGLELKELAPLSNLHIEVHGRITHLLTGNRILLRSELFRPSLATLEKGARHGDMLFRMYIDRLPYLTRDMRLALHEVAVNATRQHPWPAPTYIFTDKPEVAIIDEKQALDRIFASASGEPVCVETVVGKI